MSREEALRLSVQDLSAGVAPYAQEQSLERLQAAAAGTPQLFEWLAKDRAGRLFWVEVNLKRVAIGGHDRLLAIVRDIAERKRAERQIKRSHDSQKIYAERAAPSRPRGSAARGTVAARACAGAS